MKTTHIFILVLIIIIAVFILPATLFVIPENQQVVITQFGKPVDSITEAGLHYRVPFIQEVNRLDKRLLPWDGDPENMQTRDKKRIYIDVWARWRIVDPLKYFQAVKTELGGYKILDDLVDSTVRNVVARYNLIEAVRTTDRELQYELEELSRDATSDQVNITIGRAGIEKKILAEVGIDLKINYGMELTDVHIKRINYIESVQKNVFERMKSERLRIAQLFQSEAKEEENKILGLMKKELDEIEGDMKQKSSEIIGAADAEVIRIAAEGYSKSPEFYEFIRSLEAYKKTFDGKTRVILSSDNKFLKPLNESD
ncbi:MAG: protease modulator HflC [Phycisphaerae bacterium]|nr:protease modulator HflC [Phycisphaerae bacterium]